MRPRPCYQSTVTTDAPPCPPKPPATILAGGLSRRLGGGDKPLRAIGGRSLLARVIDRLAPQCDGLVLNANGDPARFAAFDLPVAADSIEGFAGPLAGVLAGLDWTAAHRPDARWMLSAPGDCPFLPRDLVARLSAALRSEGAEIAVAASGGRTHPVVALWPVALREPLRDAITRESLRKVGLFLARYRLATVEWSASPLDPFFNANTPEDFAAAEALAADDG
jgi:molybdopterin-guanine dinucleotide biosynthesis protein A